jgi:LSD1 subclass zinc finger protein
MPSISSCPYCREQLAVPAGAPEDADVRCPLCQAEFTLGEVQDIALPELILVSTTREAVIAATWARSEVGNDSSMEDGASASTASEGASSGAAEAIDADRIELGNEQPAEGASTIDDVALAVVSQVGLMKASEPKPNEGQAKSTTAGEAGHSYDAASFNFGQSPTESFDAEVAAAFESRPRPKRKSPNMALELAKVIGGGFLGLVLAYQILLCAGRDPLDIARSWPGFVPASMRDR